MPEAGGEKLGTSTKRKFARSATRKKRTLTPARNTRYDFSRDSGREIHASHAIARVESGGRRKCCGGGAEARRISARKVPHRWRGRAADAGPARTQLTERAHAGRAGDGDRVARRTRGHQADRAGFGGAGVLRRERAGRVH